jgi:hypothetical protein
MGLRLAEISRAQGLVARGSRGLPFGEEREASKVDSDCALG